ncbi:MAG: EcsC family protein [Acidobacteriota bacterium]
MELQREGWTKEDLAALRAARAILERPSLAARLSDAVGTPLERGFALLPERWADLVNTAVQKALQAALEVAVTSLGRRAGRSRDRWHRWAVAATGAGGGAFGLAGLVVELPVSTTLMLRSIADIARSEGEDLESFEARLSCLEVFAFGGRSGADDAAETGYFAVRSALAGTVAEAARFLAERGLAERGAPALVRLIAAVGSRFGVVVSEKVAAMAVPAIGAVGGALVNTIFISHFQDMARGHFTIRRLERKYGPEAVRRLYESLPASVSSSDRKQVRRRLREE